MASKELSARVMEHQDIEWLRKMHNENSTLSQLTDVWHVSECEQQTWFESTSRSKTSRRFVICRGEDTRVGVIRVDNIDRVNRSVMIGADIHPIYRRQGIATWAYNWIMGYMFEDMGMHRVYLKVIDTNLGAIALYEKIGFIKEGIEREALFRDNMWHDYILMSMLDGD